MKYFIILLTITFSFVSADVQFIASPACHVEDLSKNDIKKVFMLKTSSVKGEYVKVLDNADKHVYKEFVTRYLKKSPRKIKTYWTRMLFTGKKIPPKKVSTKELTIFDYKDSCYLTYVAIGKETRNWKTVNVR